MPPKLLLMTNKKSHMRFRLTPNRWPWMTLTVSLVYFGISRDFVHLGANTAKRMKIDAYCQRRNCIAELENFALLWLCSHI